MEERRRGMRVTRAETQGWKVLSVLGGPLGTQLRREVRQSDRKGVRCLVI